MLISIRNANSRGNGYDLAAYDVPKGARLVWKDFENERTIVINPQSKSKFKILCYGFNRKLYWEKMISPKEIDKYVHGPCVVLGSASVLHP